MGGGAKKTLEHFDSFVDALNIYQSCQIFFTFPDLGYRTRINHFESDPIVLFSQKSQLKIIGTHFPLYFWSSLCKNLQIPLFSHQIHE